MNPIEKSCHVTEVAQKITGFSGYRSEKNNLFCFASHRLVEVVLLLLLELAYLAGRNVCPWGIHHSNPSVRCTGEQLVPGRTNIGGNLFLFFLFFLFFAFSSFPPPTPLYFSFVFFSCLCLKKTLLRIVQDLYLVKGGVLRLMFIVGLFIVNVTKVTSYPCYYPLFFTKDLYSKLIKSENSFLFVFTPCWGGEIILILFLLNLFQGDYCKWTRRSPYHWWLQLWN